MEASKDDQFRNWCKAAERRRKEGRKEKREGRNTTISEIWSLREP